MTPASRPARDTGLCRLCRRSSTRALRTGTPGSIENKLWAHGLSQFSLWSSIAHEEVVSSEFKDKLGIWTSLIYSQALGYTPWAHYGQGIWAHLSFMLPVVDATSGDNPRDDKTRRLILRAPIFALAIKFSHDLEKITGGEGFSTCYSNGDSELQRFNPYIEVSPCSPSISWRKRLLSAQCYRGDRRDKARTGANGRSCHPYEVWWFQP